MPLLVEMKACRGVSALAVSALKIDNLVMTEAGLYNEKDAFVECSVC